MITAPKYQTITFQTLVRGKQLLISSNTGISIGLGTRGAFVIQIGKEGVGVFNIQDMLPCYIHAQMNSTKLSAQYICRADFS